MNKVHFLLGVHNHQPIGNFDFVFEKAYTHAYLPFLEAMVRHPRIHWNLHATGILWEWLDHHHADYMDRVAEEVGHGRLEILTGGYYEPILPALPDADKVGQIQKLTHYIRKHFKTTPTGMWLAERVWEPHLPKALQASGIEYTLVDDTHFLSTGMTMDELTGSFLTEEQGATLVVLPIRKDLRYAIPFQDPSETLSLLRRFATPWGNQALVMMDDGEKFGLWPDTFKHVYKDGWLDRFLDVLEKNADWISCSRISDYLAETVPQGRVYLPAVSYYEMGEWTLPSASQESLAGLLKHFSSNGDSDLVKRFLRGGFWRNFLTKYEESNNLHKKMLWVSEKVHRAVAKQTFHSKVSPNVKKMFNALWAGQCNCAYWHGVFGGLYLPHLRQALYRELLRAENLADKILGASGIQLMEKDFDRDGRLELLMESPEENIYIAPHRGGSIFEWDLRAYGVNMLNVLTRRPEGYHKQLLELPKRLGPQSPATVQTIHDRVRVKEPGLEKRLYTDWYRRASLLDHFFHPDTTLDSFFRCQYGEQGDYTKTDYQWEIVPEKLPLVRLQRAGTVWTGDQRNTIRVEKMISFSELLGWQVAYQIQNVEGPTCQIWFGSEMGFAFSSQDVQNPLSHSQQSLWQRRDHGYGLAVKVWLNRPTDLWEFPLETVSLSEEGFERTYQGTVLLVHFHASLAPGQAETHAWRVEVTPE